MKLREIIIEWKIETKLIKKNYFFIFFKQIASSFSTSIRWKTLFERNERFFNWFRAGWVEYFSKVSAADVSRWGSAGDDDADAGNRPSNRIWFNFCRNLNIPFFGSGNDGASGTWCGIDGRVSGGVGGIVTTIDDDDDDRVCWLQLVVVGSVAGNLFFDVTLVRSSFHVIMWSSGGSIPNKCRSSMLNSNSCSAIIYLSAAEVGNTRAFTKVRQNKMIFLH